MDKQELYVAASRTREQTHLYATPEIQAERSEYAPGQPERDPVIYLAEASEQDRAQLAAHEVARFEELRGLPIDTLKERHRELRDPARKERQRASAEAPGVEVRRERALVGRAIAEREAEERTAIASRPPGIRGRRAGRGAHRPGQRQGLGSGCRGD